MSFGRNDLITRGYAERMISNNTANFRNEIKDLREQLSALNIDFAGLSAKIEQLEKPDSEIQSRLTELIEKFNGNQFVTGVIQSESGTRLNTCQDSLVEDQSLNFFASGLRLPTAINNLILEILKYVLEGKQD